MTTLTLELPRDLVDRLEQIAGETGQQLNTIVAEALAARYAPATHVMERNSTTSARFRLRPVRLAGWSADATFRREEIYGDDAR